MAALVAIIAVSLGVCVGYLALDRLRHRKELESHVTKLAKILDPAVILLSRVTNLTMTEGVYLKLEYYCVNEDCWESLKPNKPNIKSGKLDTILEWLLYWISYRQIDRTLLKICSGILCIASIWVTFDILTDNPCGAWINSPLFKDAILITVLVSYLVPAVYSWFGTLMVKMCGQTVREHLEQAKKDQALAAQAAAINIVNVPQKPAAKPRARVAKKPPAAPKD